MFIIKFKLLKKPISNCIKYNVCGTQGFINKIRPLLEELFSKLEIENILDNHIASYSVMNYLEYMNKNIDENITISNRIDVLVNFVLEKTKEPHGFKLENYNFDDSTNENSEIKNGKGYKDFSFNPQYKY